MSDRLSRKDIKHDKFVEDVESVYGLASRNRRQVLIAIAAILGLAGLVWGWFAFQASQERKAQIALADAIAVLEAADPAPATPGAPPPPSNDAQKLAKAQPMFESVTQKYGGTEAADVAQLYLARVSASRGDFAAAKAKLQGFIDEHPKHLLAGGGAVQPLRDAASGSFGSQGSDRGCGEATGRG